MKTAQKPPKSPRPVKQAGRYASEEEALKAKRDQLLSVLKEADLKKLIV